MKIWGKNLKYVNEQLTKVQIQAEIYECCGLMTTAWETILYLPH